MVMKKPLQTVVFFVEYICSFDVDRYIEYNGWVIFVTNSTESEKKKVTYLIIYWYIV
jgi:hypothetical protein